MGSLQQIDDGIMDTDPAVVKQWLEKCGHLGFKLAKARLFSSNMQSGIKATGLQSLCIVGVDFLSTGTRQEVFHSSGTLSSLRLRLKRCCRISQSWSTQAFRTLGLMPSGPAALFQLNHSSCLLAWLLEKDGQWWGGGGGGVVLSVVRGGIGEFVLLSVVGGEGIKGYAE